jgi:glutathione S-transferase
MKLYHQPRTRSARVRWLLAELEVPHDVEIINVFAGEGRTPEYLRVHPHGLVPALEDRGDVFIESSAICMDLADRFGGGKLAPPVGTRERARYYEWMVYVPATADPCLETIMFHTAFLPEERRLPVLVTRAKKTWETKIEPRYRTALASRPYVLGETFSAADVLVTGSLMWAQLAGVLSDDPHLRQYLETIARRPAFLEAHA